MEENLNIFGKNLGEIGSLDKNLVLRTKGRVYIRYGRKYIDLLDSLGNLNVKVPKVLSKITSKDEIKSNGFYLLDGNLYAYVDGETFLITGTEGSFISYAIELNLDSELINTALKNIGLKFDSIDEASRVVKNGIVFIGKDMYYINNGSYTKIGLQGPLESINNSGLSAVPTSNNQYIAYVNGLWTYVPIGGESSEETFSSLEYSELNKEINFFNSNGDIVATLDVTDFLKDGMVESATISNNNLIISFNEDAGKEDIIVSLADIFDPTKYYTKTEVDNLISTATNDMATKTWVNNQGFLTSHLSLSNYYTKSLTYSKTEVDNLISSVTPGGGDSMPVGSIIMFGKPLNQIPSGWHICDGTNGTPDLTDKFIVGAGNSYLLNNTGGVRQNTISGSNLPQHYHNVSDYYLFDSNESLANANIPGLSTGKGGLVLTTGGTYHGSHEADGDNNTWAFITHLTSGTVDFSGNPISYDAGTDLTLDNRPPFYALYYIMKIS